MYFPIWIYKAINEWSSHFSLLSGSLGRTWTHCTCPQSQHFSPLASLHHFHQPFCTFPDPQPASFQRKVIRAGIVIQVREKSSRLQNNNIELQGSMPSQCPKSPIHSNQISSFRFQPHSLFLGNMSYFSYHPLIY
jgi:hypothetical protein